MKFTKLKFIIEKFWKERIEVEMQKSVLKILTYILDVLKE